MIGSLFMLIAYLISVRGQPRVHYDASIDATYQHLVCDASGKEKIFRATRMIVFKRRIIAHLCH